MRIFGAGVRARLVLDLIAWQFADCFGVEGYYDDGLVVGTTGPGGYPILGNFAEGLEEMRGLGRQAFVATAP